MTIASGNILQTLMSEANTLTLLLTFLAATVVIVVFIFNRIIMRRVRKTTRKTKNTMGIMQHAIDQGNINVVRFQPSIQLVSSLYGNIVPEEGVALDEFYSRLHADDRPSFARFISQLEKKEMWSAEYNCRLQTDEASGEDGWRNMKCQAAVEIDVQPLTIICTMTDETDVMAEQQAERNLTDRYRLIFDQSIVGLAFYDKDGMLLAANQYMRQLLHFTEEQDPFYFGESLFNRPNYRDLLKGRKVEDFYFCSRYVIPERGVNCFAEIRIHPIMDDTGQLLYISLTTRDITEERELYLQGKRNDAEILRANEEIKIYENELKYLLENCQMLGWRLTYGTNEVVLFKELGKSELTMTLQEFIGHFLDENGNPTTKSLHEMRAKFETPTSQLYKMSDLYGSGSLEWYIMNTVPVHDKEGRVNGQFGLIRNVTSLINAQEQLKRETERANDSGRLKSVFMANMTHEIRTPLNSTVGFTDLLPIITSPDDKREMIQVIKNNCDMLLRLINDILEISSMDSKEIKLEPEQVDFSQVFNRIYQGLKERVQNPSVEFLCDNPYDSCPAYLDAQRINQILTNFVTNAVKYTHQGHIKIGYSKQQDGLYIYCEDTGTGIPKEKQGKIFERFVKLNDYVQGTGLGLSICKAITDRSGGQIGVESEGDNQGSKFWVWIPLNTSIQDNE